MGYTKDYYKLLGVSKTANIKTIKNAYRNLILKYTIDVSNYSEVEHKIRELTEAYVVLINKTKRKLYDEKGYESVNDFAQEIVDKINMENLINAVKAGIKFEKEYGLISGLVGLHISKNNSSKIIQLVGDVLISKSILSNFLTHSTKKD